MNETPEIQKPVQSPSGKLFETYSTVNVTEATGTFFLGILALILLVLYVRSIERYLRISGEHSISA